MKYDRRQNPTKKKIFMNTLINNKNNNILTHYEIKKN